MPGGDGTGPTGMGPMTGRAAGYCAGSAVPGFVNVPGGRGFRGGGGGRGGRGRRNRFYATGSTGRQRTAVGMPAFGGGPVASAAQTRPEASPAASREQELDVLRLQTEHFTSVLDGIGKRIEELETQQQ